jgi:hypothetical protein
MEHGVRWLCSIHTWCIASHSFIALHTSLDWFHSLHSGLWMKEAERQLLQTKPVLVFHTHRVRKPFCFWAVLMTHALDKARQMEAARPARDAFRPACSPVPAAQSFSFAVSSQLWIKPDASFLFSLNHYPLPVAPRRPPPHHHHSSSHPIILFKLYLILSYFFIWFIIIGISGNRLRKYHLCCLQSSFIMYYCSSFLTPV